MSTRRRAFAFPFRPLAAAAVAAATLFSSPRADALVINVTGPISGTFFSVFGPPIFVPGVTQSELVDIANIAGDYWEGLVDTPTPRTFNIQVGFTTRFSLGTLAAAVGGVPNPTGFIGFRAFSDWFADPVPLDNSEYTGFLETFADLGGGRLNTAAFFDEPTGAAVDKFDLFSVALHEIGHVLGLTQLFGFNQGDVPIEILDPLPFAGSQLPFRQGHLDLPIEALMDCCANRGTRALPSDADILAVAQAGNYTEVHLKYLDVPEPTSALLVLGAALALYGVRSSSART